MLKDPVTGVVAYDPDACVGCRYCVVACPFGIPKYQYDSPTGKIGKCELCRHRYEDGHYSACAEVCPTGATLFGKTADLLVEAKRRIALAPGSVTTYPRAVSYTHLDVYKRQAVICATQQASNPQTIDAIHHQHAAGESQSEDQGLSLIHI